MVKWRTLFVLNNKAILEIQQKIAPADILCKGSKQLMIISFSASCVRSYYFFSFGHL